MRLFIVAPLIEAGIAGYLFKARTLPGEDVIPERGGGKSDVAPAASARRTRPRAELLKAPSASISGGSARSG